jgi:hypothetical protein
MASIRDKGLCPCPRCLIPLSRVQNMGMKRDMRQRETLARVDDEDRKRMVRTAREIIYEKNYAVDTTSVEILLQPQSLVPTSVSTKNWYMSPKQLLMLACRTPFQRGLAPSGLICLLCF